MTEKMSKAAQERAAAQAALKNGGFAERETYTAKQIAMRCGTDAKTLRKFFRSSHSTVEAVGQGGRYEFEASDLPKIKREFTAWKKRAAANSTARPKPDPMPVSPVADPIDRSQADDPWNTGPADSVRDHFGEDHEPTDEELEAMAELEAQIEAGEI